MGSTEGSRSVLPIWQRHLVYTLALLGTRCIVARTPCTPGGASPVVHQLQRHRFIQCISISRSMHQHQQMLMLALAACCQAALSSYDTGVAATRRTCSTKFRLTVKLMIRVLPQQRRTCSTRLTVKLMIQVLPQQCKKQDGHASAAGSTRLTVINLCSDSDFADTCITTCIHQYTVAGSWPMPARAHTRALPVVNFVEFTPCDTCVHLQVSQQARTWGRCRSSSCIM